MHEAGWPPRRFFIFPSPLSNILETIASPSYVFPSLADNTHVMGPLSEIIPTFDHLST
jgi:hypothetical protein